MVLRKITQILCFTVILVFYACKDCSDASGFSSMFEDAIRSVSMYYEEGVVNQPIDTDRAFTFLRVVTEHTDSREGTHFGLDYLSPEDYDQDVRIWQEWYLDNRCTFNSDRLQAIFLASPFDKDEAITWHEYLYNN